jgi:phosphinothricin acetyltransferase
VTGTVRDATSAHAAACRDVYAPYVTGTAVSFEADPPTAEEMARRIAAAQERHAWLVLEDGGAVRGFAYGGPFMSRAAYRWSCSVSVYLEPGRRRTGGGRALYGALLDRLAARGHRRALAGVALPNEASLGLHRALGFEDVGTYRRVGWKHGAWHDVTWLQRDLGTGPADDGPPAEPR